MGKHDKGSDGLTPAEHAEAEKLRQKLEKQGKVQPVPDGKHKSK